MVVDICGMVVHPTLRIWLYLVGIHDHPVFFGQFVQILTMIQIAKGIKGIYLPTAMTEFATLDNKYI